MRQANDDKPGIFQRICPQLRLAPRPGRGRIAARVAVILAMTTAASVAVGSAGAATDTTTVTWHS